MLFARILFWIYNILTPAHLCSSKTDVLPGRLGFRFNFSHSFLFVIFLRTVKDLIFILVLLKYAQVLQVLIFFPATVNLSFYTRYVRLQLYNKAFNVLSDLY